MALLAAGLRPWAPTSDRDAGRYTFAGGASLYPFAWSILLGARDPLALAAVIALGYPVRQPRRLRRQPVSSFATVDSIDGPTFGRSADEEVG